MDEIRIGADYILDGGECKGEPSTVVDLVNRKIIRIGANFDDVKAALENF